MSSSTDLVDTGNSIKVLENHNYHQWSDLMESYFLEHNLDGIVDGSEAQPTSAAESQNWLLRQKKAAGFIARKLDSRNRDLFINADTRRDPHALWNAIEVEYASKKARNRSRLFSRFLSLSCTNGDLAKFTSAFRERVREMSNAGVKLDDDLLAHMALHHLPPNHQTTKQVMIATAESSNVVLTVNGVLSQINELVRDSENSKLTATALNTRTRSQGAQNPFYERCTNGTHNPKTAHSSENCWQLHPNKHPGNRRTNPSSAAINGRALCATAINGNRSGKPILDTGTTQNMFKNRAVFDQYTSQGTVVEVANGDGMDGLGIGNVNATHRGSPLTFCNSLHVPSLKTDLISMTELAKKGCSIIFSDSGLFEVLQDTDVVLSGKLVDGLMELDVNLGKSSLTTTALVARADGHCLHSRLGHPGPVPFSKVFPGVTAPSMCDPCVMAKHH